MTGLPVLGAVLAVAVATAGTAVAETPKDQAMAAGERVGADEIADRIVGKTVTFEAGGKTFLFHYSADNVISGTMVGGAWSATGYYGITNEDSVCLSIDGKDNGRLRCLTVFVLDGVVKKYNADGSLAGDLVAVEDGKTF